MTKNFYKILGVGRNASVEDIKKSYHNLALRFHPDKNKSPDAEQRFREILEAYKVLSDRKQRRDYDKNFPRIYQQQQQQQQQRNHYSQQKSSSSQSSNHYDSMEDLLYSNYFYNLLSFCGTMRAGNKARYDMYGRVKEQLAPPRNPAVIKELFVTLEELYRGVTRKVKFKRLAYGGARSEEKVLEINVKPGCKSGSKITFAREGDRTPGCIPADIIFIIREKPHEYFERCNNVDLKICIDLPLHEALCGNFKLDVPTIDGKTTPLCVRNEIVKPDTVKILRAKGLPIVRDPKKFGDLIVTFNIEFPDTMLPSVRENIAKTLTG